MKGYEDLAPKVEKCTACPEPATHFVIVGKRVGMCDKHYDVFMSWEFK